MLLKLNVLNKAVRSVSSLRNLFKNETIISWIKQSSRRSSQLLYNVNRPTTYTLPCNPVNHRPIVGCWYRQARIQGININQLTPLTKANISFLLRQSGQPSHPWSSPSFFLDTGSNLDTLRLATDFLVPRRTRASVHQLVTSQTYRILNYWQLAEWHLQRLRGRNCSTI